MSIPADDRGLAYGDGVFETVRLGPQGAPLRHAHRARLLDGLTRLGISADITEFDRLLDAHLEPSTPAVVKLMVTRGSGGRGYAAPPVAAPRWLVQRFTYSALPEAVREQGMVLGICHDPLTDNPRLAGIKHLNRLEQVLARTAASRAGWDEALMLDSLGRPVELTSMNLFARFADQWWTPSLQRTGVAGVARNWCLQQLGNVSFRPLPLVRLREADEVFACNSVAGVLPVRKLAVWQWTAGSQTRALQTQFEQLFY